MASCSLATAFYDTTPTFTTGAFTPAANDLLIVMGKVTGDTVASFSSSAGLTFKIIDFITVGGAPMVFAIAEQLATNVSQTVTLNPTGGASTGTSIVVWNVSGMTRTGMRAIKQSAPTNNALGGTTPSLVFNIAPLTTNPLIFALNNITSPAGLTEPATWTEDTDSGYLTPTTGIEAGHINSGFTSTTVTWGGTSPSAWNAFAIELDTTADTNFASGFDFRSTSAFVTDPADCQFAGTGLYPIGGNGTVFGWTTTAPSAANRSAAVDARLSGINFRANNVAKIDFQIDLPQTGIYTFTLANGDQSSLQSNNTIEVLDTTTSLLTITDASIAANHYDDATQVERTSDSDWVTNNVSVNLTFATTKCIIRVGSNNAGSNNTVIAHAKLVFVSAASSTVPLFMLLGVGS